MAKDAGKYKKGQKNVRLKNSTGRVRDVAPNSTVYHRGKGRYAVYSEARDKKREAGTKLKKNQRNKHGHKGDVGKRW